MEDIKQYKLSRLFSPVDERDIKYSDISCASENITIPKTFELKYQFEVKNQGSKSTCFWHAFSEWEEITYNSNEQFSIGFLNADRSTSDFQGLGTVAREGLKHAVNEGNVLYKDFPINEDYPSVKNYVDRYGKDMLFKKASEHKAKSYVSLDIEDIKTYLVTEQKPILLSVNVYTNFYELQKNNGVIPPVPTGNRLGGHAMLIVGFDGDMLKILNSWGNIGDNGYVHLDLNSKIIRELWTLTDARIFPTPPPITPTTEILYRVQLGAFKVRENAEILATELRNKGIDCIIKVYPDMFKVQCGVFKIKENANEMLNKLINLGYKDAFIVQSL